MTQSFPVASPCPNETLPSIKRRCVTVCQYRTCLRSRSDEVLATLQAQAPEGVFVSPSDCMGQCGSGPTVRVMPDGTWYCRVTPEDVPEIVAQHLIADQPVDRLLHPRFHPRDDAFNP